MNKKTTYATAVITDIRNFTGLFEKFQSKKSDNFINFLESYYKTQFDLAEIISDDFYVNNTGDGVLTIFKSDKHYTEGYAFLLSVHRGLKKLCEEFSEITGENTSFGVGADSGHVWDVGKDMNVNLDTYVGSVINRASRLEAKTKLFGGTNAAIGHFLYDKLLEEFYPKAHNSVKDYTGKYDELLHKNKQLALISEELLVYFVFEMILRNIEKPFPVFRLSEYLAKDDEKFWSLMRSLLPEEKVIKIKDYQLTSTIIS